MGMWIHEGKTQFKALPNTNLLWMGEKGDGPVSLAAGYSGSQQVVLMNKKSTALPLGCSAVKESYRKKRKFLFLQGFFSSSL